MTLLQSVETRLIVQLFTKTGANRRLLHRKGTRMTYLADDRIGKRVEISPAYDLWMRGARFGAVQRVTKNRKGACVLVLKMDHPQVRRPVKVPADDVVFL